MSQYYLLCRNNDQENGSRFLSQQSNLCQYIKSYRVKDFYRDKGKFYHDRKWKSNKTRFVATNILILQQKVQLATKIKEVNIS